MPPTSRRGRGGRGVDHIIYVWVVISLSSYSLHLKLGVQLELITLQARQSARKRAGRPASNDHEQGQQIAAIPANSRTGAPNVAADRRGTKANATNG